MFRIDAMFAGTPRPLGPRNVPSAILKEPLSGPWAISQSGLVGDQQADTENHGGLDKALHHYPHEHYQVWAAELPSIVTMLARTPAFGENISTQGMTEDNVCIGDIYAVGSVRLQIAQGRQPCWKLNARFGVTDMAYRVQRAGRTGWYYRVLATGTITPGDEMHLLERPQPAWPLARLITLLYTRTTAFDELVAASSIPELAEGWRNLAARRVAMRKVESWSSRLDGMDETIPKERISSGSPLISRLHRKQCGVRFRLQMAPIGRCSIPVSSPHAGVGVARFSLANRHSGMIAAATRV